MHLPRSSAADKGASLGNQESVVPTGKAACFHEASAKVRAARGGEVLHHGPALTLGRTIVGDHGDGDLIRRILREGGEIASGML